MGELEGLSVEGVNSCTGGDEDITNDFTLWGSDDPNVATLTSKQVKAIGAGFTYGYANGDIPVNDGCGCIFRQSQPTVPATVVTVAFTIQSSGTPPTDNSARDAYKSGEEGRLRLKENTFRFDTYPTQRGTARAPRVGECADKR